MRRKKRTELKLCDKDCSEHKEFIRPFVLECHILKLLAWFTWSLATQAMPGDWTLEVWLRKLGAVHVVHVVHVVRSSEWGIRCRFQTARTFQLHPTFKLQSVRKEKQTEKKWKMKKKHIIRVRNLDSKWLSNKGTMVQLAQLSQWP